MLFTPARRNHGFDLFDDFFNDSFFAAPFFKQNTSMMKTDVKDDGSNYLLEIDLPGFDKENIKAELQNGYLIINATREDNKEDKDKDGKFIRQERSFGSCTRSYYVGEQIRQEDIKGAFENGVLKMQIPKKNPETIEAAPQYIAIEG